MGARRPSAAILHHRRSSAHPPGKDEAAGQLDLRGVIIMAATLGVIGFFWVSEFMPTDGDVITEHTPYRLLVEDRPRGAKATREPPKPVLLTLESCAQLVNEALKEYVERRADDRVETTTYHRAEENRPSKRNPPAKAVHVEPEEPRQFEDETSQDEQPAKAAEESATTVESDEETEDVTGDSGEAEEDEETKEAVEEASEEESEAEAGEKEEEAEGESDVEEVLRAEEEEEGESDVEEVLGAEEEDEESDALEVSGGEEEEEGESDLAEVSGGEEEEGEVEEGEEEEGEEEEGEVDEGEEEEGEEEEPDVEVLGGEKEGEGESDVEEGSEGEEEEADEVEEDQEAVKEDEAESEEEGTTRVRRDVGREKYVEEEESEEGEAAESEHEVDERVGESDEETEGMGAEGSEEEGEVEEADEGEDEGASEEEEREESDEEPGEEAIGEEELELVKTEQERDELDESEAEPEGTRVGSEGAEESEEEEQGVEEDEEEEEDEEATEGEHAEESEGEEDEMGEIKETDEASEAEESEEEEDHEEVEEKIEEGKAEGETEVTDQEEQEREDAAVLEMSEKEEELGKVDEDADIAAEEEEEEEEEEEPEILPSGQRSRKHIGAILGYKDIGTEGDKEEDRLIQEILKDLKKLSINAIQPMENLYKFKDISTRLLGDAEIFNKPLVLFLGPWSSGKSTIINYLLGTEYTKAGLKTGPQPTDVDFTIIHYTEKLQRVSGTEMAAHWAFSGVQKFGQRFLDHFKGIGMPHPLLQKVTIVDTPGILEKRRVAYPLNDVFQWFIDRADAIYFVFDPSKLEIGEETTALLDQIKGRESQTRFLLNKADFVQPHDIMRVTGQLLWNVSPLLGSTEAPIIYTVSLTSRPFHKGTPARFFLEQERAFLEHLREIMDERVENTISFARRHAVRVRNHAKLVDCYLSTFYKQKGIFGSKKKVAEQITKEPQKYHIFEGLSKLTNVSRYDLPDPQLYYKFFKLNTLYEFKQLSETCSYFKGCPLDKLDMAIAYDLPQLLGKYNEKTKIRRDHDGVPSDESPVPTSEERS
ncbi:uncharacterized protein LOC135394958 [Ornithodoros turicata]|uniref:uncharacterized protein LOC135394958 n=1 Tax=Ornithodoros turicata TaxID=34597 RepID=UPI0031396858